MVAWLVEEHAVGLHEEDAGERHAHLPAAGQGADVAVHPLLAEAQARQHLAGPTIQGVAVQLLEPALHLAVARDDGLEIVVRAESAHDGLQLAQLGRQRAHRASAVHHLGDRTAAGHLADVLAEIADRHPGVGRDLALVGLVLAGDHPEQRRLARPVGTDETDLFTALQSHGRLDEEDLVSILLADGVEADHGRGFDERRWPQP